MKNVEAIKTKIVAVLSIVLIAAMAFMTAGCKKAEEAPQSSDLKAPTSSEGTLKSFDQGTVSAIEAGQGERYFTFTVDIDGEKKVYNIKTDKTTVGAALLELGLISGEDGPYGLYVKTVDGVTLDYEKDKAYWSFYVDGGYAMSGVDKTDIVNGKNYSFKKEKA